MTLSLRTKTIIVSLGALIVLALGVSVASVVILNVMKERLVADAINLAEEMVTMFRKDMEERLELEGVVRIDEARRIESVRDRLEGFELGSDLHILHMRVLDLEGRSVIEHEGALGRLGKEADTLADSSRKIKQPIIVGDRPLGDLEVMLLQSDVLGDIQRTSGYMRIQMAVFLAVMSLILAAVSFLLWRMFIRHLDIVQRQDQMERMAYVGTLASGLAHEIRNPLNAMGLKIQVLEEDIADPQPGSEPRVIAAAGTLRNQIAQLNAVLGNFLSFAAPKPDRQSHVFDLCALIRESHDLLSPEIERRQVRFVFDGPENVSVRGEPAAMQEVFVNLFLNALQAMDDVTGEKILDVRVESDAAGIRVEVTDTGKGVSASDRDRIFDVFYSTRDGGSGFGLAIARRIVKDHGGTIRILSRPERGACFRVELPAMSPDVMEPQSAGDGRDGLTASTDEG